jgi:hypothetical protein
MGTARYNSDIDIALCGHKLQLLDVLQLRGLFDETTLPYMFDLLIYQYIDNAELLEHIKQHGVEIFKA